MAVLWLSSLALPVWETRSNHDGDWSTVPGVLPALIGWLGILVKCPAWFANPFLIVLGVTLFKKPGAGFWLSLVAIALAASAYTMPGLYGDNDEAVIMGRLIGFYIWLGSFLTIALAHALLAPASNRNWVVARVAIVALMVLAIISLEKICPVGVSPLETSLKDPNDVTALTAVLARHPPQAEKDAALRWAIRQELSSAHPGPSKQVVMLLAAGANPNQPDEYGNTLLMKVLSRRRSSEALVKALVQAGADVNAHDSRGKTVLDIAQGQSSPECQKILSDAGARASGH